MASGRWLNQSHPQTLLFATFLLYFDGVTGGIDALSRRQPVLFAFGLAIAGLAIAGGRGIANNQRSGFAMAAVAAFGPAILRAAEVGVTIADQSRLAITLENKVTLIDAVLYITGLSFVRDIFNRGTGVYSYVFELTLIGLLFHRQTTEYRRIWFT